MTGCERIEDAQDTSVQALESALPESVASLMDLVAAHAGGGAAASYSVMQLLRTAAGCAVRVLPKIFH